MSAIILLCIGVFCIVIELFLGSFFLCFLGIGFIASAVLSFFVDLSLFANLYAMQAITVCVVSLLALFILRKPLKRWFERSSGYKDSFNENLNEVGEVREGMIYFQGTLWRYEPPLELKEGEKVRIKGIKNHKVLLEC